jgi:hypothetical protein
MSLLLDRLPVELIFEIFSYLTTLDTVRSFSDLSPYMIQCLSSYDRFNVNFQSIRKTDFHRICSLVRSHQIISLILSDDDHTPGQIGLFLSRVSIDQFVQLRVLHLIGADDFFAWHSVPACLSKLPQLHSIYLDFDNVRLDKYDESHSNLSYIFRTPTVTSLFLANGRKSDIDFKSLPVAFYLHTFKVQVSILDDLSSVLSRVPNIHTLQLTLRDKRMYNSKCLSLKPTPCPFVTRLSVKFEYGVVIQQVQQFLESFKHQLIFLKVETDNWEAKPEAFDADWWKTLITCSFPKLKTFQLRVSIITST